MPKSTRFTSFLNGIDVLFLLLFGCSLNSADDEFVYKDRLVSAISPKLMIMNLVSLAGFDITGEWKKIY